MKKLTLEEFAKKLNIKHKETKRTIHFENSEYLPFLQDKEFMIILYESMQRCGHTLNLFSGTESNEEFKKLLKNRNEWISKALKDPLLSESDKLLIKRIGVKIPFKKNNQLWSELAKDLQPAFKILIKSQKDKKTLKGRRDEGKQTARFFLLEALSKWYPDNSVVAFGDYNSFSIEEKLSKHLK